MKRLTIEVENERAVTIVQLLIDQAVRFHVDPIPDGGENSNTRRRKKYRRTNRTQALLSTMGRDGNIIHYNEFEQELRTAGLAASSAPAAISRAVRGGLLIELPKVDGRRVFKLKAS